MFKITITKNGYFIHLLTISGYIDLTVVTYIKIRLSSLEDQYRSCYT